MSNGYYPVDTGVPIDPGMMSPMPGYDMMPMQGSLDEASLVKATTPEKVVEHIEHILKGEEYDEEKEKWFKKYDALMNDKGIRSLMIDIKSVVNQNTILSNLEDSDVRNIIIALGDTIIGKIMMRREDFSIDRAEMSTIVLLVCNMSYMALKRGYIEGERKFLRTTIQQKIGVMSYPGMEQKKGIMERFKIFK